MYNITKLSKDESKQRLLVEGASLDAPNIVVELDGERCGGTKVVSRSRIEVECSGSAGANSQYHYGPPRGCVKTGCSRTRIISLSVAKRGLTLSTF